MRMNGGSRADAAHEPDQHHLAALCVEALRAPESLADDDEDMLSLWLMRIGSAVSRATSASVEVT